MCTAVIVPQKDTVCKGSHRVQVRAEVAYWSDTPRGPLFATGDMDSLWTGVVGKIKKLH